MYALHPITIHFPIALLLANVLFSVLYLWRGDRAWESSAYHCLLFGWIACLPALATGTYDAIRQLVGPDAPRDNALISWVNAHAFLNIAAMVVYGQALLRRRRNPGILDDPIVRRSYLTLLAIGAITLSIGGWIGGHLVYILHLGI